MLDATTKARIDSARDILVGKVPDPKSQVEQITIALIYKFMDDMDRQSEEVGGKATFFTGEFKKYRWAQLLDKRFSGHERLILYAEGIEKMNVNKNIPQLFRDIFKGVFLPYRDPETLNLFLKEIDGFTYEHSERLGDAFEYLLSVLGTQGDAGQFRTPRHIIDFIVTVVDPKKTETILDPACGTAGFLISAFKHILHRHDLSDRSDPPDQPLTPDERARLMTNFRGYDIAPDMVRLSRVNMYLHGFPNPTIHEYDALTSEERWDERCDVILANPPFMTPKGGIRPHNRFSIKAKRSEVLFVDYIAEHLNPGGRAGVIVPEGIIFQSQNAYKQLRKMLVENYLWAVVSLPAGVFNPYSGVKTSILFLDRNLARQRPEVLFVKVENDGFDLGAQRRPIEKNDLPMAMKALLNRRSHDPSNPSDQPDQSDLPLVLAIPRARLLESPDINLSGDRYRPPTARPTGKWPMVKIGEVCEVVAGQSPDGSTYNDRGEGTPFHQGKTEFGASFLGEATSWTTVPTRIAEPGDIVMSVRAPVGPVNIVRGRICIGRGLAAIRAHTCKIDNTFLFHLLRGMEGEIVGSHGAAFSSINRSEIESIQLPLPPLDEQERIVAELEGYRKVIEGARQILAVYKPTIRIDPAWPVVPLGDIIEGKPKNGYSGRPVDRPTKIKVLSLSATTSGRLDLSKFKYLDERIDEHSPSRCRKGDIYLQRGNTSELVGTAALFDVDEKDYVYPDLMIRVRANESVVFSAYLLAAIQSPVARSFIKNNASGSAGSMPKINQSVVESIPIPLPPLAIQRQIVADLEAERKLVEANRELIARMEAKIKAKLAEVWGEDTE